MTEVQILFQLEKLYGKVMTLEQALEVMGRVVTTMDELIVEGHDFDEIELINELGDFILNEE
jgi:hypothetical protein